MPYYVYAIHTDSNMNRLYKEPFDDFHDAEKFEKRMNEGRSPSDNYVVRMFYAENEANSIQIIDAIRKENNWPSN